MRRALAHGRASSDRRRCWRAGASAAGTGRPAPTTRRSSTSPAARRWWSAPERSARARSRACCAAAPRCASCRSTATDTVRRWAAEGRIELELRAYESADLDGCFLVIAATEDNDDERARVRGRGGAPDALQRRRRHAPVQLHPALDRAPRRPRDRRLDRRREPRDGAPHPARAGAVLRRRVRGRDAAAGIAARGAEGRCIPRPRTARCCSSGWSTRTSWTWCAPATRTASRPGSQRCIDEGPGYASPEEHRAMLECGPARVQAALPAAGDREPRRYGERDDERAARSSASRTRPRRSSCASASRCPRAAPPACCASWSPRRRSTRRWRSRPATAPSSTWWSATTSRPRAPRSGSSRAQADIRPTELVSHLYSLRNGLAARHLFRVTAGLDAMIVGEAEIQGQVKRAYELALVENTTSAFMNRLFREALGGRQARPHRDRDRQQLRVAQLGRGGARAGDPGRPQRPAGDRDRRRRDRRADRARADRARRQLGVRREPPLRPGDRAGAALRRPGRAVRHAARRARAGGHRGLLDRLAASHRRARGARSR